MRRSPFVLPSLLLFTACPQPEPTIDDEACEHLADGPASAIPAVASGEDPMIGDDHTRYDITLVPGASGHEGSVRFAAAEAGDHVFFLDADVPLEVRDASGAVIAIEEKRTSGLACPELGARVVVPLGVGTVSLRFGPTAASVVRVVVELDGDHAE